MRRLAFILGALLGCCKPAGAPCDTAGQCGPGLYCNAAAAACLPCDDEHAGTSECGG